MRRASGLLGFLGWSALCWASSQAQRGREAFVEGRIPPGSDIDRLIDIPVYVISTNELRWQRTRQVLGTVHLMAERVHPPKATLKLAQEAYKVHNYDKDLDLSDVVTQRELSLTATWDRLIAHIARHTDMEDDDFACVFEDDIALHDDVTHAVARRAILHGMELGRADGLLSLGMCAPDCQNSTQQWVENVKFEKCASLCTHAVAVTKRKAGTLMADLHAAVHEDFEKWGYDSYYHGHAIDQQLRLHAWHNNGTWTAGTNLYSMETPWWDTHLGLFYQDRWRARPSINPDGD